MVDVNTYMSTLIRELEACFGERLEYVGLQGSYERGEAQESSDIDPLVVLDHWTRKDLDRYRAILEKTGYASQSCGFICGREELACWNRLEICHLLHSTMDYVGCLQELVPAYTKDDLRQYVILSLNNMIHELCHRYVHADPAKNIARLPQTYKGAFFILQGLCKLRLDVFPRRMDEMEKLLAGEDLAVLHRINEFRQGAETKFESDFDKLFTWCQKTVAAI